MKKLGPTKDESRFQYWAAFIWLVALICILLVSCPSNAAELKLGLLSVDYKTTPGVWYDPILPHVFEQNTPSFSVGLEWAPSSAWRVGAGYRDLGDFKMTAIALSDDTNPAHTCTSMFITSMRIRGFYAESSLSKQFGAVRGFVTGGLYRARLVMDLTMENIPLGYNVDGSPYGLDTVSKHHDAKWVVNPYFGVGIGIKDVEFALNYQKLDDNRTKDGYTPSTYGAMFGSINVRF